MMTVYEDIMAQVRPGLLAMLKPEECREAEAVILSVLGQFDFTPRCREIVVRDNTDEELMKRFLLAKGVQGLTRRTLGQYYYILRTFFQDVPKHVKDITPDDIRIFLARKKVGGTSDKYLALFHRTLSSFYTWMEKEDLIERNPIARVERIKIRKKVELALTEEQMEAVRFAARNKRDAALIEFLYSTGCRCSEAISLNRADVNFETGEVLVIGKGEKQRIVYLSQRARFLLLDYLNSRKDKYASLFAPSFLESQKTIRERCDGLRKTTPEGYISRSCVEQMCRKIGKRVGFRVHPHGIRRTMATSALRRGMPIEKIQVLLGHESIATTTIYAQSDQEEVKAAHVKFF